MRALFLLVGLALLTPLFGQGPASADAPEPKMDRSRHPLDPLSEDEIKLTSKLLKDETKASKRAIFTYIGMVEPKKVDVLTYKQGDPFERRAKAVYFEPATSDTVEAIVNLNSKTVESRTVAKGQGPWNGAESRLAERLVRADPRWIAAVKKRGFDPLDLEIGAGPNRGYVDVAHDGSRYVLAQTYYFNGDDTASFDDLLALVNVTKRRVEWVRDGGGKTIHADPEDQPENQDRLEPTRPAPKDLKMTQPDGATFTMEGNLVRWQNWRFRIGYDPRIGMILYTVGWEDGDKVRSILYRAALSELYVPYGDPNYVMVHWFDAGEFGLGTSFSSSFVPMNDAPGYAKMIPAIVNDERGRPRTIPNAMALYERDGGILWRHGGNSRRARDLVLASIHQAGNYDYCFQWIFHQDGTIEQQVVLSGYMETKNVERVKDGDMAMDMPMFGTLVAPHVEATNHQHFFSFRVDMDVDGTQNQLVECNVQTAPAAMNAQGNGFYMSETPLRSEKAAQRDVNALSNRCWKIVNPSVRNKLNQASAYMLMPGEVAFPYARQDSFLHSIAGFVDHQLWATPYDPAQLYAGGDYVFDGAPNDGLRKWASGNRSLDNQDLVLYLTVGVTHIPRVEDWPMMDSHHAGFMLMPAGFFSQNAALGVPPTKG